MKQVFRKPGTMPNPDPDDEIDPRAFARDIAQGVANDARAMPAADATRAALGTDDDAEIVPTIPLDLEESDYTFRAAPRPRASMPDIDPTSLGRVAQSLAQNVGQLGAQANAAARALPQPSPNQPGAAMPPAGSFTGAMNPSPAASAPRVAPPSPPAVAPQPQTSPGTSTPNTPDARGDDDAIITANGATNPAPQDPDADPEINVVPTATGAMRPEAAPMLMPQTDRARKMFAQPDAFGPNAAERDELERARVGDERSDRVRRALRGVGGILGLLGAGARSPGLAAIGAAIGGPGAGAVRGPNARQDAVRARIAERVQAAQREREAAMQGAQMEQTIANSQRDDARQARLDDANISLIGARTELARTQAASDQVQRELANGNITGARQAFRALVGGLNDNSDMAQMMRRLIASPEFEQMSAEDLDKYRQSLVILANNRHSGLVTRGGGSQGGRMRQAYDAAGNPYTVRGGGGGGPAQSTALPPTYSEIQAQQAAQPAQPAPMAEATPAAPTGRRMAAVRARRTPGVVAAEGQPAAAATPADADPILAYIHAHYANVPGDVAAFMRQRAIANGVTPENITNPTSNRILTLALGEFNAGEEGQRRLMGEAGRTAAAELNEDRPGPQIVDRAAFDRARNEVSTFRRTWVTPFRNALATIERARRMGANPRALNAVIQTERIPGGYGAADIAGLNEVVRAIAAVREAYARPRSGAAISSQEWTNFDRQLGNSSVFSTMEDFERAMQANVAAGERVAEGIASARAGGNGVQDVINEIERLERLRIRNALRRRQAARSGGAR